MVLFVEQLGIENLAFHEFIYRNPPILDYITVTTLYSGWNAMFGTVAESIRIFFEVPSYNIYIQNICYEYRTHISLKGRFQCKNSEACLSLMCFAAQDFEALLRRFQFEQPMIQMLYPFMIEMIRSIMTKFIRKNILYLRMAPQRKLKINLSIH